ncbi:phosphoadenosine phosphosulfate reductase [Serinicoccus chungangensis]|uniref:Phosphoadenosine 5'-phosphosulfate reductase n=1 Tax=Serinicoccus chungangensis TaxID=767452 RepID=A0A0W8I4T5_9MICO|nr:phosphoadenylyl-sulfate reductase [Serinicoccus chungangensis]KUG53272.1 phosphoadenosine phosphosulfate reductase [Serinicoccus chungangensis]
MSALATHDGCSTLPFSPHDLGSAAAGLEGCSAQQRIDWALQHLPGGYAVTSSFGVQSAVMLHLVTRAVPDVPVLLFDTGYLFPETYRFVDELTDRLGLNLHVYRSPMSPAWQEARFGRLWEQGVEGITEYNRINKVEPMQRAMTELGIGTWFSGLRREQSTGRAGRQPVEQQNGRVKVHPVVDWTDRDVHRYLTEHDLPYHPLFHEGYLSIGDTHTTRRAADELDAEGSRFFGLVRECGLHVEQEGA